MPNTDPYSRVEYRRLIAWPERIRREWPLLEEVLSSGPEPKGSGSRRVLDLGSGTGEHARYLADRGFEVVGIDASESMLEKALDTPLPPNLRFVAGDISRLGELDDELLGDDGAFSGAICLGNTLPHLKTEDALAGLTRGLRRRLAPGAPALFQLLNYDRIFERRVRHLPVNFRPDDDGQLVFLRLMEPEDDGRVWFYPSTLQLVADRDPPLTVVSSRRVELRGWRRAELEPLLEAAGFDRFEAFGAYDRRAWSAAESRDLILVAR